MRVVSIVGSAVAIFIAWMATDGPANAGLGFAYAIPVGLVAWWCGARWAALAVVGVCALFLIGALSKSVDEFGWVMAMRASAFVGVAVIVTLLRSRVVTLEHSAEELEALRSALAPPGLPEIDGVDLAVAFVPSELGVSGDFHLVTRSADGSAILLLGDVVGHGPRAARLATFVRARLAACAENTGDPAELLAIANAAIIESSRRDALVSAVCLRYSLAGSKLSWAVAGHAPPLRLPDAKPLELRGRTILLGVDAELELPTSELVLGPGEGVLAYTDGATDLRNEAGERLGDERLTALLARNGDLPAAELVAALEHAIVAEWSSGPVEDDLCLLALRATRGG